MASYKKYTIRELHKQFSPNLWNPQKDKIEVVTEHLRISADGTNQAREDVPCNLDNSYGDELAQKFDVYGTDLPPTARTFIWVHGGGWQFGSKDLSGFFAPTFYKRGIRTCVLGYTLGPNGTVTNMLHELKMGLNAIMELCPDSKEFILGGHSAGGHIVSSIIHDESFNRKIGKIILFSGVYDLRPFRLTSFNRLAGITESESLELSSILRTHVSETIRKQRTRILILVGKYEPPILIEQSKEYFEHLKSLGVLCEFWLSEEDDHFSIIENLREPTSPLCLRLHKFLGLASHLSSRL